MNRQLVCSILFATSAFQFTPALAREDPMTARVSYADLNLTSAAGQKALDSRVRRAVRTVCGDTSAKDLAGSRIVRTCQKRAFASARPQVMIALAKANRQASAGNSETARLDIRR